MGSKIHWQIKHTCGSWRLWFVLLHWDPLMPQRKMTRTGNNQEHNSVLFFFTDRMIWKHLVPDKTTLGLDYGMETQVKRVTWMYLTLFLCIILRIVCCCVDGLFVSACLFCFFSHTSVIWPLLPFSLSSCFSESAAQRPVLNFFKWRNKVYVRDRLLCFQSSVTSADDTEHVICTRASGSLAVTSSHVITEIQRSINQGAQRLQCFHIVSCCVEEYRCLPGVFHSFFSKPRRMNVHFVWSQKWLSEIKYDKEKAQSKFHWYTLRFISDHVPLMHEQLTLMSKERVFTELWWFFLSKITRNTQAFESDLFIVISCKCRSC